MNEESQSQTENSGSGDIGQTSPFPFGQKYDRYEPRSAYIPALISIGLGFFAAPSLFVIAFGGLIVGYIAWILALVSFWKARGAERILAWFAVFCNAGIGMILVGMFFGLCRYPPEKFSSSLPVLIADLIVPLAVFSVLFFVKLSRRKNWVSKGGIALFAVLLVAAGLFTGHLVSLDIDYKRVESLGEYGWVCEEREIVFEPTEEGAPKGYITLDGKRTKLHLYDDDLRAHVGIEDGVYSVTIFCGDISFSDGGKTMTLSEIDYWEENFDLGTDTLTFARIDG